MEATHKSNSEIMDSLMRRYEDQVREILEQFPEADEVIE